MNVKEKQDREDMKQVLRQVLECYKNLIDIMKVNKKLEDFMIQTIDKLLAFCLLYKRKAELKRFIDYQKNNLNMQISKDMDSMKSVNHLDISNIETNDKHI